MQKRGPNLNPRILFVYQVSAPFVLQDRDLLAKHLNVIEFRWVDYDHPARALTRMMFKQRRNFDLVFVWFGDFHASVATSVARYLRKPSIVVVGGYDVSDVPGYGFLSRPGGLRSAQKHFRRATRILPVSATLESELVRRFPGIASKIVVLPTGVDVNRFQPGAEVRRGIISVAGVETWTRARIKGWDRIVEVATLLPEISFLVVGASSEIARRLDPPPNLEIRGPVAHEDLIPLFQRTSVYLQASRSEGLPNALMEAMSCGCVPVVTNVGGMPELVKEVGLIANDDPRELATGVKKAMNFVGGGLLARRRVVERYSLAQRELGLLRIVNALFR